MSSKKNELGSKKKCSVGVCCSRSKLETERVCHLRKRKLSVITCTYMCRKRPHIPGILSSNGQVKRDEVT